MKTNICFALSLFISLVSLGQSRIAVEVGMMQPVPYGPGLFGSTERQRSDLSPAVDIIYLRKIAGHLFLGGKVGYETYSYTYTDNNFSMGGLFGSPNILKVTTVGATNHYIFLAPVLDLGIGRHQYVHVQLRPSVGFFTQGAQTTEESEFDNEVQVSDRKYNTTSFLNATVFRLNIGFTEHLPLNKQWHLTLSESLGILNNGTPLSQSAGTNNCNVTSNSFSLQLGIMRKYRHSKR